MLALAMAGCESSPPRPTANATADELAVHLAARIGYERALRKLDVRGETVLIGLGSPQRADSDEPPAYALLGWDAASDTLAALHPSVRSAARGPEATFAVDAEQRLLRLDPAAARPLLSNAAGKPAPLADGSVVVARATSPGETDLWHVSREGHARAISPAPGPDDLPFALADGRIVFVSGRTTVASLWIVDPSSSQATQLTNRGLVAGKPMSGFVPPPTLVLEATASELVYDAGGGDVRRVTIPPATRGRP